MTVPLLEARNKCPCASRTCALRICSLIHIAYTGASLDTLVSFHEPFQVLSGMILMYHNKDEAIEKEIAQELTEQIAFRT